MKGMATKFIFIIILAVIFLALLLYSLYLIKTGGIDLILKKVDDLKNLFRF